MTFVALDTAVTARDTTAANSSSRLAIASSASSIVGYPPAQIGQATMT
jgi:hypothetical protein